MRLDRCALKCLTFAAPVDEDGFSVILCHESRESETVEVFDHRNTLQIERKGGEINHWNQTVTSTSETTCMEHSGLIREVLQDKVT